MGFINERIFILKFAATTHKESETNNTRGALSNSQSFMHYPSTGLW